MIRPPVQHVSSGKGAEFQHACYRCQHACYGPHVRVLHDGAKLQHDVAKLQHGVSKLQHGVSNIRTWRFKTPNMHVTDMNIEHACYRCEHGKISVYLSPQKQEHHRHPTVPTHQTRQIPTHNTLVCASRTNNTYTFHALPRKILCQAGTSPKSHCPPAPAW